ncbi:MAG: VWA domain-containing protein [Acidobacteria bacterium]|nr:MAG: VWA domain-containing protein [Acidobacteriota bacterium]
MRRRVAISFVTFAAVAGAVLAGQEPRFRSGVNLVLVDVVVRDRSGAIVTGLTADDFELVEDGARQQILTFAFEHIGKDAVPISGASVLAGAAAAGRTPPPFVPAAGDTSSAPAGVVPSHPLSSDEVAGHRLLTLLFDTSSMQPEDVQKAVDGAVKWVDGQMTPADLVAVAAIHSTLQVLSDFTGSKERLHAVLSAFSATDGTAFAAVDSSTASTDEAAQTATDDATAVDQSAQELDTFNNDVRLRALKTLAEALRPIQQKKAIIYFSSGMQRSGTDNQVELRAAVNAAVRANVAIYPVDARGLQTVVPGGAASRGSRGGLAAFTGSAVAGQFGGLAGQQETLTSLASDTGGTAFTDTNDFGEAFAKVERDISSYYILGFSSTNTNKDGRFRRLTVRVRTRSNLRVEAKQGYYADRDFAHTARSDREILLQEQLGTPIPATDVPVFVTAGWFRLAPDKYYVPIALAVPGSAIPASTDKVTLDVAGFIRDERGAPVGRIRDTLTVPPASADGLAARQVLYETGVTLPPGRFSIKIAVRENAAGRMGTFEAPVLVPELKQAPVKVSSVVLSTQLQRVAGRKTPSPLTRDGVELVPNLTHIVRHDQTLYLYYEVYDPAADHGAPQLRTNLGFYRGRLKVFETPVVERTTVDAGDRHAAVFQFEVPAASFKPGLYTCQINIIDAVAGRFAFPRLQMYVR